MSSPTPPVSPEPHVFTVSEVSQVVRQILEQAIGQVWVEGEVSNFRKQPSGHQYFTLKDAQSQLQCVMFARQGQWRKSAPLTDGMHVIARGVLTVYEARGQYQLNVQHVQAEGAGLLQAKFEALKRKLEAEGLFDPSRKRSLPPFPTSVGIVTSASGAALRDMLNILARRAPWVRLVISPVRVQGEGAAEEITAAVEELNRFEAAGLQPVDVIIVSRGGGSAEDLWEFNEELLARAIAASAIPVISAVGHEIDFTIADFVADLRAPTPSAAAELVAPNRVELQRRLAQTLSTLRRHLSSETEALSNRLDRLQRSGLFREPRRRLQIAAQSVDLAEEELRRTVREKLALRRECLQRLAAAVRQHRPDQRLAAQRQQMESVELRLARALNHHLAGYAKRLSATAGLLRLVSPQATLERGYTITTDTAGTVLRSAIEAAAARHLVTRFADGSAESDVRTGIASRAANAGATDPTS